MSRGKDPYSVELTKRNLEILKFLWRWKVVTTATVYRKFFSHCTEISTTHRELRDLEAKGMIHMRMLEGSKPGRRSFAWCLKKKGFNRIKEHLPSEMEDGFRSENPDHDLIVSAVHLGPLASTLRPLKRFSEQELRRVSLSLYPEWVPKTTVRRPDGYWLAQVKEQAVTIALEVELTRKSKEEYECLSKFYSDHTSIFRAIWVVKSMGDARYMASIFKQSHPLRAIAHDFVVLKNMEEMGWNAPIFLGKEEQKPLMVLLQNGVPEKCRTSGMLPNLDGRRYPTDLMTYSADAVSQKSDRPVFQTVFISNNNLISLTTNPKISTSFNPSGQTKPLINEG